MLTNFDSTPIQVRLSGQHLVQLHCLDSLLGVKGHNLLCAAFVTPAPGCRCAPGEYPGIGSGQAVADATDGILAGFSLPRGHDQADVPPIASFHLYPERAVVSSSAGLQCRSRPTKSKPVQIYAGLLASEQLMCPATCC